MQQGTTNIASKQGVSTLTRKGQVTIPVKVRMHLGVNIHDKVAFVIEPNGEVKVSQVKYPTVESLRGIAGSLKKPLPWKEVKRIAYEDRFKKKYGR